MAAAWRAARRWTICSGRFDDILEAELGDDVGADGANAEHKDRDDDAGGGRRTGRDRERDRDRALRASRDIDINDIAASSDYQTYWEEEKKREQQHLSAPPPPKPTGDDSVESAVSDLSFPADAASASLSAADVTFSADGAAAATLDGFDSIIAGNTSYGDAAPDTAPTPPPTALPTAVAPPSTQPPAFFQPDPRLSSTISPRAAVAAAKPAASFVSPPAMLAPSLSLSSSQPLPPSLSALAPPSSASSASLTSVPAPADAAGTAALHDRIARLTVELATERSLRERDSRSLKQREHALMETLDLERDEWRRRMDEWKAKEERDDEDLRRARADAERLRTDLAKAKDDAAKKERERAQREGDDMRRVVEDRGRLLVEREELLQRVEAMEAQLQVSIRRDEYDALDALRGKEREELIAYYEAFRQQQAEDIAALSAQLQDPSATQQLMQQRDALQQQLVDLQHRLSLAEAAAVPSSLPVDAERLSKAEQLVVQYESIINQQTSELDALRLRAQQSSAQHDAVIADLRSQLHALQTAAPAGGGGEKALREELEDVGWKLSTLEEEKDSWGEERHELHEQIRGMQAEIKGLRSGSSSPAMRASAGGERKEREAEVERLRVELSELQAKLQLWETNVDELQADVERRERERLDMLAASQQQEAQLRHLQQSLDDVSQRRREEDTSAQHSAYAELNERIRALEAELLAERQQHVEDVGRWRAQLDDTTATLRRREDEHQAELQSAQEQARGILDREAHFHQQMEQLVQAQSGDRDRLEQLEADLRAAREQRDELSQRLSEKEEALSDLQAKEEEREDDRRREREAIIQHMQQERDALAAALDQERGERTAERADLERMAEEMARMTDERDEWEQRLQQVDGAAHHTQQQLDALLLEREQLTAQSQSLLEQYNAVLAERDALGHQVQELTALAAGGQDGGVMGGEERERLQREVELRDEKLKRLVKVARDLKSNAELLTREKAQLEANLHAERAQAEHAIVDLRAQVDSLSAAHNAGASDRITELGERVRQLTEELARVSAAYEERETEASRAREAREREYEQRIADMSRADEDIQRELSEAQRTLLLKSEEWQELDEQLTNARQEADRLHADLQSVNAELQHARDELTRERQVVQHEREEAQQQTTAFQAQALLLASYTAEVDTVKAELRRVHADAQQTAEAIERQREADNERINDLISQLTDKEEQLSDLSSQLDDLRTQHASELDALRAQLQQLQQQKNELERRSTDTSSSSAALEERLREAEARVGRAEQELREAREQLEGEEARMSDLVAQLSEKEEAVYDLQTRLDDLSAQLSQERSAAQQRAEDDLRSQAERHEAADAQRTALHTQLQQLTEEVERLRRERAQASTDTSRDQELVDEKARLEEELRRAQEALLSGEARTTEMAEQLAVREERLADLRSQLDEAQAALGRELQATAEREEEELRQRAALLEEEETQRTSRAAELDHLRAELEHARAERARVEAQWHTDQQQVAELRQEREVNARHLESYRAEVEALKVQVHELNGAVLRHEEEAKQTAAQRNGHPPVQASAEAQRTAEVAAVAPAAKGEADGWDDWGNDLAVDDSADLVPTTNVKLKASSSGPIAAAVPSTSSSAKVAELEERIRDLESEAEGARADATAVYETLKAAEAEVERLKSLSQRPSSRSLSPAAGEVDELRARIAEMEEEMRGLLMTNDEDKEALDAELAAYKQRQADALAVLVTAVPANDLLGGVEALVDSWKVLGAEKDALTTAREKEEDSERERLRAEVGEWRERYDGVLRVQAAMQHDGEEAERENKQLTAEILELRELIAHMEDDRDSTAQLLQQLQERQQVSEQPSASSAPTAVDQEAQTSPPPSAPSVEVLAAAESSSEAAPEVAPTASTGEVDATVPAVAGPVYTEADMSAWNEQRMREREELIAYYSGYLAQQQAQLDDLNARLVASESRQLAPPPVLDTAPTVTSTIIPSAEQDVKADDAMQPAQTEHVNASGDALPDELSVQATPPSTSFSLSAETAQPMDADALSFSLQPVSPPSPLHQRAPSTAEPSDLSQPSQSVDGPEAAPPVADESAQSTAGEAPAVDVAAWLAAVNERDAQIAAMGADLAAWSERYTQLCAAYDAIGQQLAAVSSQQADPSPPSDEAKDSSAVPPDPPSRKLSGTPAALQEANGADFNPDSRPDPAPSASSSSPPPDLAFELELHRQRLYDVERERQRLKDENDDLRYSLAELTDKHSQLQRAQDALRQQSVDQEKAEVKAEPVASSTSPHALHLSLLQQEMAQVQAAVDERDRFITLTLARIAAYQQDRDERKRKDDERQAKEKSADAQSGSLVGKLWGGKKKEKGPEDDDSMEWNGREWVKKVEEDAVSALLPLPSKPKPLPPSALPADLPSLNVEEVMKRLGLRTGASPAGPLTLAAGRTPGSAAALLPPRPSNQYAAVKQKTAVSARYASSFDDFGFEAEKAATPTTSPSMAAVLSPPPPDADLSATVFTPAAPSSLPPPSSLASSDDPRLLGRSIAQLLDELDAAHASVNELSQQLAITSSLPRPLPSPAPDQPAEMEVGHLRGLLRSMEVDKLQLELALSKEKEQTQLLHTRIESMKQLEAGLIDDRAVDDEADGSDDHLEAAALLLRLKALRRRYAKLNSQLHLARQHLREVEQERERSSGRSADDEDRRRREADVAVVQRERDGLARERDALREEREQLIHRIQELSRGAPAAALSTPSKALVRQAGDDEVQRLREVVRELERSLSDREEKEGGSGRVRQEEGRGGVVTATVRVNGFFILSFVMLLAAVLGVQALRPEWIALGLGGPGPSGGGGAHGEL